MEVDAPGPKLRRMRTHDLGTAPGVVTGATAAPSG